MGSVQRVGYSWMGREYPVLDEAYSRLARERIKVKDVSTAQEMTRACSLGFLWLVTNTIRLLYLNKPAFDR